MKNIRINSAHHSIDYYAKSLVFLLIPILFINIVLSFLSITTIKKQNLEHISSSISIYATALHRELSSIDHFMYWSVLHEKALDDLQNNKNINEYNTALKTLRTRLDDFNYSLMNNYTFFGQITNTNTFVNLSPLNMSYTDYEKFRIFFEKSKEANTITSSNDIWHQVAVNQQNYLYRSVAFHQKILYVVIDVDSIVTPLRSINIGTNGSVTINKPIEKNTNTLFPIFDQHLLIYTSKKTQLPFPIYVSVDYSSAFQNMVTLQFLMMLIPVVIGALAIVILIYIRQKVIRPVQRFTDRLIRVSKEEPITLIEEGIVELNDASDQITYMVQEMQKLRIDVYESELTQKRMELNFLRSQIQPHFYLNILSTIHSMVQTSNYKEIEQLTLTTSQYLRYLFQSNKDFVSLNDELGHINHYLNIQKLRYGDDFHFYLHVDSALINAEIPPLILQTFIENNVKHSYSGDTPLIIDMTVCFANNAQSLYSITLKDNGPGFPSDILRKLEQKQSLVTDDGKHIGLTNVLERLDLLYGAKNYQLIFENQVGHGTKIKLIVPYKKCQEGKDEYFTSG